MISLTSVNTILGVFKSIKEAAESIVSLRDETLVMGKVEEINSKLIDAQNGIFAVNEERSALVQMVSALEKELASLKTWEAEKQRYVLVELAPGVVAYAIRDDMRGTEPFHYLCANCFSDGKKAFLQQQIRGPRLDQYKCNVCGDELTNDKDTGQISANSRGRGGADYF